MAKLCGSLALALLLVAAVSCDSTDALEARFISSGTASAADLVRFVERSKVDDTVTVDVVIGGPTTSDDIFTFDFRVRIGDTSIVSYVEGSAVAGPAMHEAGCPDPLMLVTALDRDVSVGLSQSAPCAGHAIDAAQSTLVSLTFRVVSSGATAIRFGTAANPPVVLDSDLAYIDEISFDPTPATIAGL